MSAPCEIHERVLSNNMVLDALRGIPQTNELVILPGSAEVTAPAEVGGEEVLAT